MGFFTLVARCTTGSHGIRGYISIMVKLMFNVWLKIAVDLFKLAICLVRTSVRISSSLNPCTQRERHQTTSPIPDRVSTSKEFCCVITGYTNSSYT